MCVGKVGSPLGFYDDLNVDLDIFVYNVCELLGGWTKDNRKCSFLQEFEYALDLFPAFCSVFIRLYLNLTINCLENFICRAALVDKNKMKNQILTHASIF